MSRVLIEAHRGICTRYPENTLAAFRGAASEGYDMIELDMKFTADGECVIFHDWTLDRTARRRDGGEMTEGIRITELTLAELEEYEVGSLKSETFRGEPIPRLSDALEFAANARIPLKFDNVLFKFPKDLRESFYQTVAESGLADAEGYAAGFTVSSMEAAEEALEHFPNGVIHYDGALDTETVSALSEKVKKGRLFVWAPLRKMSWLPFPPVTREDVERLKPFARVGLWIVDHASQLDHALSLGADIIETTGCISPADVDRRRR